LSAITQLLLAIVSGEAALVVAAVTWATRRLIRQLDIQGKLLDQVTQDLGRHLAWHEGLDDRNAWRMRADH
jgi:predicted nucleic acid-binding Zn ribbon protein